MFLDYQQQISEFNEMTVVEFLSHLKNLNQDKKNSLITNPYLIELSNDKFKVLFFNLTDEEAKIFLKNKKFYAKVLGLTEKKHILSLLENNKLNFLKLMFENENASEYVDEFIVYLQKLKYDKFKELSLIINFDNVISNYFHKDNITELYNFLKSKFRSEIDDNFDNIFNILINKINNNILSLNYLIKVNHYKELVLFAKFNLLVEIDKNFDDLVLTNGFVFPYKKIFTIKESKINKIIELLRSKGKANDAELLEVSLKLYYVFGFDNAKKIIEDKFTNMTESAIVKITDFNYKDDRREYRAKNQKKFYYYGMVQEVLNSLVNSSNKIFEYLSYNDIEESNNIKKDFLLLLSKYSNDLELKSAIKELLKEKIYIREQKYKEEYYQRIQEKYKNNTKKQTNTQELLKLLKNVDLIKIINSYDQKTLDNLQNFLLGNTKVNNDCLFRIIMNKEALGLNDNLFQLINNFKIIKSIAERGNLSLNSILDVIDILKINLYHLRPNEQDIYLSTLTKIINSTEFCDGNDDVDIVRQICDLHVKRKEKVYSSIPSVKGLCGDYTYEVAPFDSEYLLSSGCDSKNCFKISGKGEDFFKYCLTSNQAVVIYIRGNNKTYIVPVVRSGNMINCNNLDPIIEKGEEEQVINTLKVCLNAIIESSDIHNDHEKNIEIATITNWHLEKVLTNDKYETITIDKSLPIDKNCYTDYNKSDIINYILVKKESFKQIDYYLSEDRFYQKRTPNYEFNINNEYDKERLSLLVNSIRYTSVDYQNLSEQEKNKKRREFEKIDVSKFKYIIGNKDWYIAIDDTFNVLANILPYDERAKKDYFSALANVSSILDQLMEESEYDRHDLRKNR